MLSIEQIRPLVLHDDWFVRLAAVTRLARIHSRDETILLDVLSKLDGCPHHRRNSMLSRCATLPVSEAALTEITKRLHSASRPALRLRLAEMVAGAPLVHLDAHRESLRGCGGLGEHATRRIQYRRQLASLAGEVLWEKLQKFVRQSVDARYVNEINHDYADALVDALAASNVPDTATLCRLLESADANSGDGGWLEIFLVDMAGCRGVREAVPILVEKLHIDADYLRERVMVALARIGDPAAVNLIARAFPRAAWDFRLYACDALRGLHCREAEEAVLALLAEEESDDIRTLLCDVLCDLFSQRGVDVVLEEIRKGYDTMMLTLEESLLPVIDVLGCPVPQADLWRNQRLQSERRLQRQLEEWDAVENSLTSSGDGGDLVVTPSARGRCAAGRNEPCPCGSGRKYKKCCGGTSSYTATAQSARTQLLRWE